MINKIEAFIVFQILLLTKAHNFLYFLLTEDVCISGRIPKNL